MQMNSVGRMPVGFIGHGPPLLALDVVRGAPIRAWGASLPKPRALLVLSAHWEMSPLALGRVADHRSIIYDFGDRLPAALFSAKYAAPGAPELADRIAAMLERQGPLLREDRGIDHGVWVPLLHMFPHADIPVLQLSIPHTLTEEHLLNLGKHLAPLRDDGVFILGSGNITHNLSTMDISDTSLPPAWAVEFDAWVKGCIESSDINTLIQWQRLAPAANRAHPTPDHFRPLLVAVGAAGGDAPTWLIEGFEYGSISRRTVQFG